MVPKKRTPFFGMAGVTLTIDRMIPEHLAPLTAMRVVAGGAADLHVANLGAKQVSGALEQRLTYFRVATETGLLHRRSGQHVFGQPGANDLCDFVLGLVSEGE